MRRIASASSCAVLIFALVSLSLAVTDDPRASSLPAPDSCQDRQAVDKQSQEKQSQEKKSRQEPRASEKPREDKPTPSASPSPKTPSPKTPAPKTPAPKTAPVRDEESPAVRLVDDPDNLELLRRFVGDELRQLTRMVQDDPAQATVRIAELKLIFNEIRPTKRQVQHELGHAKASLAIYEKQVAYSKVTLPQAGENWQKRPEDIEAMLGYFAKLTGEIYKHSREKSAEAEQLLSAARELVKAVGPKVKSEAARKQLSMSTRSLDRLQVVVAAGQRLEKVVGEDAIPLRMDAWVNGTAATNEATRGKVVLIAFWAIWSSPCVATFPRLREWQAKYAERDLVMVGATRYYNFRWDDRAKRANRGFGMVSRESEREMLGKFADHHELPFVIGIQESGGPMGKHYGVIELPHFVVIDAAGKVRLAKGGSDPRIMTEVDKLLGELLAAKEGR